jgi:hypothetical protein
VHHYGGHIINHFFHSNTSHNYLHKKSPDFLKLSSAIFKFFKKKELPYGARAPSKVSETLCILDLSKNDKSIKVSNCALITTPLREWRNTPTASVYADGQTSVPSA